MIWVDVSKKNISNGQQYVKNIFQNCQSLGKCGSKPQWNTISLQLEGLDQKDKK
jgi:hypothetical protein